MTDSDQPNDASQRSALRKRGFLLLAVLAVLGALAWGVYWLLFLRHYQTTDDAYVSGDVVQITSQLAGTVTRVSADDTQSVTQGQLLVELDPADALVETANAEAELARAVRNVRALLAQEAQLRSQLIERQVALHRSETDVSRRQNLVQDGAVSIEEMAHAKETITVQHAGVDVAREQLNAISAQTLDGAVASHPEVLRAAAGMRAAALALRRTRLTSPVNGVVAKRSVQIGERVASGAPLMAVVPLAEVWIDANFKENQLKGMRVGQPATVRTDMYGNGIAFHGKVAGLSAGSGSAFALLPTQNASGNWIKIVQRLPVRIVLDPSDVRAHLLRIGLSTRVSVDTSDQSGSLLAGAVRAAPLPAQQGIVEDAGVEQKIEHIIAQNSATPAMAQAHPGP